MGSAGAGWAAILDAVFQQEDGGQVLAKVGFIDHDRTLLHQMVVLFAHDANDGFEQRVTGTDERCHGLLVHLALLEADAFILLLNWRAVPICLSRSRMLTGHG